MPPKPKELPPMAQVAKVTSLATSDAFNPDLQNAEEVDKKILDRIRKCLERGHHPNTPEAEAKAALRMSSRLMAQYNVSQAEVLAAADTSTSMAQLGGQAIVRITSAKAERRAINQTWVEDLVDAMEVFFDCKSYSTQFSMFIEWTFYGISVNTDAAAMSFEMVHNLIQDWVRSKKGISTKNSYCLGVARGLYKAALREKQREEGEAKQKEHADLTTRIEQEEDMRHGELKRLESTSELQQANVQDSSSQQDRSSASFPLKRSPSPHMSLDEKSSDTEMGDDDDIFIDDGDDMLTTFKEEEETPLNPFADFETQLRSVMQHQNSGVGISDEEKQIKEELAQDQSPVTPSVSGSADIKGEDNQPLVTWASTSALTLFRKKAEDIADEYLKSKKVKLTGGRARDIFIRDPSAYNQGKKDSAKIDVKRRRIEGPP